MTTKRFHGCDKPSDYTWSSDWWPGPVSKTEYIIIRDENFMYPVLRSDVARAGFSVSDLRHFDEDQYADWCRLVPSREDVGSQRCIDECRRLLKDGAEIWDIEGGSHDR